MILRRFRDIFKGEAGASAVEFALILPILLLILIGIIEFGLTYHDYLAVTHAAREGARLAAVNRFDAGVVASRTGLSGAVTAVHDFPSGNVTGDPVRVTVTYNHEFLTGYLSTVIPGFPSAITIQSVAEMALEQPGI